MWNRCCDAPGDAQGGDAAPGETLPVWFLLGGCSAPAGEGSRGVCNNQQCHLVSKDVCTSTGELQQQ